MARSKNSSTPPMRKKPPETQPRLDLPKSQARSCAGTHTYPQSRRRPQFLSRLAVRTIVVRASWTRDEGLRMRCEIPPRTGHATQVGQGRGLAYFGSRTSIRTAFWKAPGRNAAGGSSLYVAGWVLA